MKNKIIKTTQEVIENQILVALDDKSKVAILASESDLNFLIEAANLFQSTWCEKYIMTDEKKEFLSGLIELRDAAFKKSSG